jgi:hypothetical protein
VVYSELMYTSKAFMKHVCAIEYSWIEMLVPKLKTADARKLTGIDHHSSKEKEKEKENDI